MKRLLAPSLMVEVLELRGGIANDILVIFSEGSDARVDFLVVRLLNEKARP